MNQAGMQWVVAALLLAVLGSACERDDEAMPAQAQLAQGATATVAQVEVPNDAATVEMIEDGERVTISGTVEKMPPADQARRLWNLPQELEAQLATVPVYINANRVEEAGPGKMTMNFRR